MLFMMGTPLEDLELAPLNRDLGRYFGTSEGILVINVPEESRLGLKAGDVVLRWMGGRRSVRPTSCGFSAATRPASRSGSRSCG